MSDRPSRRRVLAGALASLGVAGCLSDPDGRWVRADVPTDATLHGVVATREGAYAVGEDGIVLARADGGWSVRLPSGPAGARNELRSVDVTDNGRTVWFAGDSGALGAYDVVADRAVDFTAPNGLTSSWEAIAVGGLSGSERLFLVNSSGFVLRGRRDGTALEWAGATEPTTGSSVAALDVTPLEYAYLCDTDGGVYESGDGGETWRRLGVEGASVTFHDAAAVDPGHVSVVGGNGVIYRYDGGAWSRTVVGQQPLTSIVRDRYDGLAVSAAGGVYERSFDGWEELEAIDAGNDLRAVTLGTSRTPRIIVGESGTVLERRF
ncbi:WD40/YVTN/BNR-like repeat-containing protein [Saliphagus infecundisoli]|uniref:WD40/YVTN/BNR-like repeat-containing protein n=1 Tax=Saliphagus infecundisoli TaxID=1849069 RepID=A0ABD5QKT3_9EURY|nr:hypothetical protein [Saliphagus infecundisoli]